MKKGFTLAEVLITLGIIGVVAALTMPSLISNYQKKVWTTQFKKAVSVLQNHVKMINASEGMDIIYETNYGEAHTTRSGQLYLYNYKLFPDKIASFLKLEPVSEHTKFYEFLQGLGSSYNFEGFILKDGSCIAYPSASFGFYSDYSGNPHHPVFIDVNCDKGPNKAGRDRFIIEVDGYGGIYMPVDLDNITSFCKNEFNQKGSDDWTDEVKEFFNAYMEGSRLQCGYAIMTDGWEMNY